ncbi:hypothetical protein FBU59_002245 [Linderina macrospora]|uniref:Uncharacterized protein n=1 Tax=Linderina macrospora TaxID=4868 RepID=A0ACC1JBN5_9FUNG|nr:hypothetical protein FBU59_002245 [Linderina macrospora]
MAELRRQTQAVQVVQDLRNRMAAAYAPVREARWEYASAAPVAQWYDYYAESLHAWRDQFVIQQQEVSRNALAGNQQQQQALAFCQQVNELEQDLERERTVIGRRADHAAKQIEQNSAVAHNALQAPVRLTREQQYQIDQEQRVFELLAERNALRRHAEIGERMAEDLAKQNAEAMRVVAACLCSLKQAMGYVQTMDQEQSGAEDSARRDMVVGQLDAIYSQAITAFTAATGAVRRGVGEVRAAGGPSMLVFSGSSLVPPSPFVPRKSPATSRISQTDHTLPPPPPLSITDKSFDNSLVMEDSSFASNGTDNPGHEPLPPAARPAKGILKNTDKGKAPASTTGPVRFGSAKRKERVLRAQRNPMGRGNGTPIKATPPKSTPTKPTTTVRELSFRSLGGVRKPAFK